MKGIRRTPTSWQVYARVHGRFVQKRFPLDTTLDLKREREKLVGAALLNLPTRAPFERSFADDATDYLGLVTHMPSYRDRAYRIQQWVAKFGPLARKDITAKQIATVLEDWRRAGLSPGSLNQRRTALMHLYTKLDGKSAANIVRDVAPYDERDSVQTRAQPMDVCARVVRRLRPWGKMRAILHVLMWTGWPHALLKGVTPADIDWKKQRVRLGRRKKGKGMPPAWVPVVPRAMLALRRFDRLNCYGDFSNSSLHSALARAVASENLRRRRKRWPSIPPMRPYDLRHSFATWAAGVIKDDRALKELLRTNSIARYTEGALAERLESARDQLAAVHKAVATRGNSEPGFRRHKPSQRPRKTEASDARITEGNRRNRPEKVGGR